MIKVGERSIFLQKPTPLLSQEIENEKEHEEPIRINTTSVLEIFLQQKEQQLGTSKNIIIYIPHWQNYQR